MRCEYCQRTVNDNICINPECPGIAKGRKSIRRGESKEVIEDEQEEED